MSVVKLKDRNEHVQLTPREALEESLELCDTSCVNEVIVFLRAGNDMHWRQGGGQTRERVLWNLTVMINKFKKEWWG